MCGIAGFWQPKENNKGALKEIIIDMINPISHRGPDDSGFYVDTNSGIALGNKRLSIIDLSANGHLPMESFSKRYIIVYNGEVYNYKELKKELINKFDIKFKSTSDTEVILAGFEVWGIEETLKKCNGMFAFALWDKRKKKLYLGRDRIGIKPIYFGIQDNILFFASELKAIKNNKFFKSDIDRDALSLFFRYSYIPAPYSIYKDIKKLKPAHYIVINRNLNLKENCYWDIRKITKECYQNPINLSTKETVNELERLLLDSVKKRMISDVPLGAFLSGGIDSSLMVALAQSQTSKAIQTFTVGFYDKNFNEAHYARKIAKYLKTDHNEIYISSDKAMEIIPKLPLIYDEPFSDPSEIPMFYISQFAKKKVTVSLSGDGGDELFGGYNRYIWADKIWNRLKYLPFSVRDCIKKMLKIIPTDYWDFLFLKFGGMLPDTINQAVPGDKLYKLADTLNCNSANNFFKSLISNWKNPVDIIINSKEPNTILDDNFISKVIPNFKERMMFFDLITYLPDDILTKVDRSSMAVSLEARVPFLDHKVIEFSKRLPTSFKIKNNTNKWILRKILYKYIPEKIMTRTKMGFGIPLNQWLKGDLREWAEELLDDTKIKSDGILNPKPIKNIWKEYLKGKGNWQYLLWDVLMFQAWK